MFDHFVYTRYTDEDILKNSLIIRLVSGVDQPATGPTTVISVNADAVWRHASEAPAKSSAVSMSILDRTDFSATQFDLLKWANVWIRGLGA